MHRELENKIGYKFKDKEKLIGALMHSSYANEKKDKSLSNERLEFLGDSVLGFITAEFLYLSYSELPEGELTKLRAALVCEHTLFECAKIIDLGKYMRIGKGEEFTKGRERPSLLADAFEAITAAIYLDGGIEAAKNFLTPFLEEFVPDAVKGKAFKDYKTILQEIVQRNPADTLEYVLIGEEGPDHNKLFISEVRHNGSGIGKGSGKSKKEAEQYAAKTALEKMEI